MDEIQALFTIGAAAATGIAGWLIGSKSKAEKPEVGPITGVEFSVPAKMEQHSGLPYEYNGRKFAPRRDHRHEYTVMVDDGWGWRCGVVTDGVECGRPREARRGV